MKKNIIFYIHGENLGATHFHWFHKKIACNANYYCHSGSHWEIRNFLKNGLSQSGERLGNQLRLHFCAVSISPQVVFIIHQASFYK